MGANCEFVTAWRVLHDFNPLSRVSEGECNSLGVFGISDGHSSVIGTNSDVAVLRVISKGTCALGRSKVRKS